MGRFYAAVNSRIFESLQILYTGGKEIFGATGRRRKGFVVITSHVAKLMAGKTRLETIKLGPRPTISSVGWDHCSSSRDIRGVRV